VYSLTIASKFAATVASAESVAADLKSFALETQDQQAKQMFQQLSQTMDNTVSQLRNRLNYIMQEEPQYASEIQPTYGSPLVTTQSNVVQGTQTPSPPKKPSL
jgi:hypothetical protein